MYRFVTALALVGLCLAGSAGAAGYSIYEHGTSATAQAGAFIARADDPSAIFYNPAGIAGQERSATVGATIIINSNDFTGDGAYPGNGVKESQKAGLFYPPHAYVVAPVGPVTVGVGIFAPFGMGTEWDKTYTGRASSTFVELEPIFVNPVVAYEFGPASVGLGLNVLVSSKLALKRAVVRPVMTQWIDMAEADISGEGDVAYGLNVGVQYNPIERVTLGASYRSEIESKHTGTAKFSEINPLAASQLPPSSSDASVEATIPFPAIIGVGLAVEATPQLTVEVNVIQMQWSVFDTLKLDFEDAYSHLNEKMAEDYEDSRSYRIGAEYRLDEKIALRCGYLFDESPSPDESVSTLLPDADRNSYTAGIGYTLGATTIDLAYMYLPFNDRSTELVSGRGYDGLYETTAHLFGLTLIHRF